MLPLPIQFILAMLAHGINERMARKVEYLLEEVRVISRLETVAEYPTVPLLVALCEVLRASADELLGLQPPPKVAAPRQPPEEKRLWRHVRLVAGLPEMDQRAVLRLIDTAAKARRSA